MRTAVVAFCLVIATSAGGEEAAYRVWGGDSPVEAAANGYTQQVRPVSENMVDVSVSTSFAPIGETSTYGQILTGERPVLPPDFSLPPRLAKLLTPDIDAWEAATVVLIWVARHLQVDGSDPNPQDAVSVLARGRGRCSGVSNAAVALLRAAGFQARTVSGLLIGEGETIPHRWLECRFPNSGWVPSDPTLGLWTITPRHVVFADTVMSVPKVEIIEEGRDGLERLPSREGRLLRPNYGAGLVCRMATESASILGPQKPGSCSGNCSSVAVNFPLMFFARPVCFYDVLVHAPSVPSMNPYCRRARNRRIYPEVKLYYRSLSRSIDDVAGETSHPC